MQAELHHFIDEERWRFESHHNNMFAYSFGEVGRYEDYLEIIADRHQQASDALLSNVQRSRTLTSGSGTLEGEGLQLYQESHDLHRALQFETESFYLFAKILLDKVAHAVEFYFGPGRKCALDSHDNLVKQLNTYIKMKGLTTSDALTTQAQTLKSDVSDFRDYQIAHHKSPRTIRGVIWPESGQARVVYTKIYPKEGDTQTESRTVTELLDEIRAYVVEVVTFVQVNRERTALTPSPDPQSQA